MEEGEGESLIKARFGSELERGRKREIERGVTLVGPHRDDLAIFIGGINATTFGSQGEQRSAILALKLALLELIKVETGEEPILLLDDVMSELDDGRRPRLLAVIREGTQAIITSTNRSYFSPGYIKDALLIDLASKKGAEFVTLEGEDA